MNNHNENEIAVTVAYDGPKEFVATDRTHKMLRFALRAERPIPEGTEFRLVMGGFRCRTDNNPQKGEQWRHFAASVEGGSGCVAVLSGEPRDFFAMAATRLRGVEPAHSVAGHSWSERMISHSGTMEPARFGVGHARVEESVAVGGEIALSVEALLTHQAPIDAVVYAEGKAPGAEDFESLGETVELRGVPGPVVGIVARLTASPGEDGGFRLHVHGRDAFWNPAEPSIPAEHLEIETLGEGRFENGCLIPEGEEPVRLVVRDRRNGFTSWTNPTRRADFDGRRVFFGEFHWHSRYADGDREPEAGYAYARDTLGLDFCAVTNHSPKGIWKATGALNEAWNEPGHFSTIPAWEWSTRFGHANIYLRAPDVPAGPERLAEADHPGKADWPEDAVVIPHHTNIRAAEIRPDGETAWFEYNWSLPNKRVRLVELLQTRGNFEADTLDGDWGVITSGIGASVRDALAMGYRVGFTGGTDNHTGFPSRDSVMGQSYVGLTGILAEANEREALWRAMDARRTYATSGVPILARWTVNGMEMGEEGAYQGGGVRFSATLHGTAPIERIEVIADGEVVWRAHPGTFDVAFTDEDLPVPAEDKSKYYYLRLRQFDGHRAWLSPVWLDA